MVHTNKWMQMSMPGPGGTNTCPWRTYPMCALTYLWRWSGSIHKATIHANESSKHFHDQSSNETWCLQRNLYYCHPLHVTYCSGRKRKCNISSAFSTIFLPEWIDGKSIINMTMYTGMFSQNILISQTDTFYLALHTDTKGMRWYNYLTSWEW